MKKFLVCLIAVMFVLSASTAMAASAENFHEMFTKGGTSGWLKANWWNREFDNVDPDHVTLNFGMKLKFDAAVYNGFTFRAGFYANEDFGLNDPDADERQYGLLGQNGTDGQFDRYQTWGEYYLRYTWQATSFTIGSEELKTGGFSFWPARMIPMTYENVNIVNKSIKGLKLHGGYVWAVRDTATPDFKDVSEDGWFWAEGDYRGIKGARINMGYFYYTDSAWALNLHATYKAKMNKDWGYNVFGLYRIEGENNDDDFDTYSAGLRAGLSYAGHKLEGQYAWIGDESDRMPRGAFKAVQIQINGVEEADEDGWAIVYGYKFGGAAKGLSAGVTYAEFDRTANDRQELDLELRYRPKAGMFKYSDFRVRYAAVDEDNNGSGNLDDFRFYYTYSF